MAGKNDVCSIQLITGDGTFNVRGLDNFSEKAKLRELGLAYAVVSIIGPQSSGKSTLANHLFGTKFAEMDAYRGRSQTTQGIWLAKADSNIYPCVLVLDVEGCDGVERGQDDNFEKHTALFALAISDVILINMWCHDVGRENAGNRPLLKTVFEVMMRMLSPRRRTLIFVLRDKTKTSLEEFRKILTQDMQKIYDSISKPASHKDTPLSNIFNIQVYALSSYEEKEEDFKEQVSDLKLRFINSTASGGLAEDKGEKIPASEISSSAPIIWRTIKENKDLDLPSHKIMVAETRCGGIAKEKYEGFASSKEWRHIKEAVQSGSVSGFGKNLSSLLDTCLSEYDAKTCYFDKNVQSLERQNLQEKLQQLVRPTYQSMLKHLRVGALNGFKDALSRACNNGEQFDIASKHWRNHFLSDFDEGCKNATIKQENWGFSSVRNELCSDIDKEITLAAAQIQVQAANAAARAAAAHAAEVAAQAIADRAAAAHAAEVAAQAIADRAAAVRAADVTARATAARAQGARGGTIKNILTTSLKVGFGIAAGVLGIPDIVSDMLPN